MLLLSQNILKIHWYFLSKKFSGNILNMKNIELPTQLPPPCRAPFFQHKVKEYGMDFKIAVLFKVKITLILQFIYINFYFKRMPNQLHNHFWKFVQRGNSFWSMELCPAKNINSCSLFNHKQFYILWKRFFKALTGINLQLLLQALGKECFLF